MQFKNVTIKWPENYTGMLCNDILAERNLLESICNFISEIKDLNMIAWGATKELQKLNNHLLSRNLKFRADPLPSSDYFWTIDYFGSKAGF